MTKLAVAFRNFANAPKTMPSYGDWKPFYVYYVTARLNSVPQPDGHSCQGSHFKLKITGFDSHKMQSFYGYSIAMRNVRRSQQPAV